MVELPPVVTSYLSAKRGAIGGEAPRRTHTSDASDAGARSRGREPGAEPGEGAEREIGNLGKMRITGKGSRWSVGERSLFDGSGVKT